MPTFDARDPVVLAAIEDALSRPPAPPRDIDLFSSNTLFGQPGIYPDGSPMAPAGGDAPDEPAARAQVASVLRDRARAGRGLVDVDGMLARFDGDEWRTVAPDPLVRAALACGEGLAGGWALVRFPVHATTDRLGIGPTASPGRVVGPPADGSDGSDRSDGSPGEDRRRVINERYRAEHPALLAPSVAHDIRWTPATTDHTTEALLHALLALLHVQAIAASPRLAHLGTELTRRQNSLAITLLNSRPAGSSRIALIAPDGPGTIPGGAPSMQSPDFWSIPFGPEDPAHPVVALGDLYDAGALDAPRTAGDPPPSTVASLARLLDGDDLLHPVTQLRANVVLGLIDPAPLVAAHADLGPLLADAMAVWP